LSFFQNLLNQSSISGQIFTLLQYYVHIEEEGTQSLRSGLPVFTGAAIAE